MAREEGFQSGVKEKLRAAKPPAEPTEFEKRDERLKGKAVIIRTNCMGHWFGYWGGYRKVAPDPAKPGEVTKQPRHIITLQRARRIWTEPGHTSLEQLAEHGHGKRTVANVDAEREGATELEHRTFGNPKSYRVLEVENEKVAQSISDAPLYEHPVDA